MLLTAQGAAAHMKVVFFPSGAEVTDHRAFAIEKAPGGGEISFELPGQARPQTLTVSTDAEGLSINDISWTRDNLTEPPAVAKVRKLLEKAETERDRIAAKVKALDGGIEYWKRGSPDNVDKSALSEKISDLVVANLSQFYAERAKLQKELSLSEKKVAELQRRLREVAGLNLNVWKVKVSVAGKSSGEPFLELRYMVDNCGWRPKYRLDAYPGQNMVNFSFDAEIRQAAGFDLQNAKVELATLRPHSRIAPPAMPSWVVRPRPEVTPRKAAPKRMMMEASSVNMAYDSAKAPAPVQKSTYSLWVLGKRNLPAGKTRKFNLVSENWSADFSYLARPSLGPDVFVSAKVEHDNAMDLPSGEALVFMEGTMLGKQRIDLTGKEVEMFFGSDPLMKAEFKNLEKQSGEKGLFGSGQTYSWEYLITVENNRKSPRTVKVEEPLPVSRDKRIELESTTEPKAETKDNRFVWNLKVPASGKATAKYNVELKAPSDMKLDLGLRR